MGFVMWIVVWMIVGALAVASIPVLVVGTWYVVMTLILGVADAGIWILDLGSRMTRGPENRPRFIPMPTAGDIDAKKSTSFDVACSDFPRWPRHTVKTQAIPSSISYSL
jgi:hypothetical protein